MRHSKDQRLATGGNSFATYGLQEISTIRPWNPIKNGMDFFTAYMGFVWLCAAILLFDRKVMNPAWMQNHVDLQPHGQLSN